MAVNITDTEINPTYTTIGGGGRRTATETELAPTFVWVPTVQSDSATEVT